MYFKEYPQIHLHNSSTPNHTIFILNYRKQHIWDSAKQEKNIQHDPKSIAISRKSTSYVLYKIKHSQSPQNKQIREPIKT